MGAWREPVSALLLWAPQPAIEHAELLALPVHDALRRWAAIDPSVAEQVLVVEIDPELADTAALIAAYDLEPDASVNCVLVVGRRAGAERVAAVCVSASTRADVNNAVRRLLDARRATFLPAERATTDSGMEYGGITPVGLPAHWQVLLDEGASRAGQIVIGSGLRRSKLVLPARLLATMPGVQVAPVAQRG